MASSTRDYVTAKRVPRGRFPAPLTAAIPSEGQIALEMSFQFPEGFLNLSDGMTRIADLLGTQLPLLA
jgi:hypothetical protein